MIGVAEKLIKSKSDVKRLRKVSQFKKECNPNRDYQERVTYVEDTIKKTIYYFDMNDKQYKEQKDIRRHLNQTTNSISKNSKGQPIRTCSSRNDGSFFETGSPRYLNMV